MRRLLLLLPLLISGVIAAEEEEPCRRQFFAQPVVYDRAMDIDFYYTGINMESVAACAEFCGGRHFCRTAVYNTQTKTCAISYEYTLSCRYTTQRYEKFEHKGLKSHLIQVACVSKCNSTDPNTSLEPATGEPERRVSRLRRVGIVTGPPIDGPSFRAEQSGFLNSVTIDNITNVLPANDPVKRKRKGQVCFRLLKRKYLLGAMFERHEGVTINQCRCLCAATYVMDSKYMCESLQWFQSGTCILNKASHRGKYDLIDDSQAVYQYIDCDVPVLLDMAGRLCMNDMASTTTTTTTTEATTTTTEEPTTTTTGTTSIPIPEEVEASFPNAPPETTTAGTSFVTGQPEGTEPNHEELETTSTTEGSSSFVTGKPVEPEVSSTTETTSEPSKEPTSVEQTEPTTSSAFVTAPNSAEETSSSAFVTESPSTAAEEKTESSTDSTTAEVTESSAVVTEAVSESTTELAPKETTVLTNSIEVEEKLPIEKGRCFERIPGHVMRSVAAALEHDVSIDECQCFCAASRLTGRLFDCASATYYPEERDCVLNIEDRHQKPQFFEAQEGQFKVTYLGITCDKESAIALYSPSIRHGSCRVAEPTVAPPTKNRGAHSDACFVELPSFVLEGTAQHVETDVTPEECKCLCAQAEQLFGEACQSFQYYYDGKTCLLNKQNRFSNAEYFNFVPSAQPRSYFEATCVGKAEKLRKYLSKSCPGASMATTAAPGVSPVHDEPQKPEAAVETVTSTELMSTTTEQSTTTTTTTTVQPTTTSEVVKTTKRKPRRRKISINRAIPEAEGLDENGFELELSAELSEELEKDSFDDEFVPTKPLHPVINNNVNHDHNPERHKVRGVKTKKFTDKEDKGHVLIEPTTSPATTSPTSTTQAPSTTTTKKPSTTTKTTTTTTTTPGITYPPAGRCTYSALYQTAFLGRRLLKTIFVKTATDCFAACFALRCRSANLVAQGTLQQCELFRDSLIDYRRPDMIGFDAATVYFDGIRCDGL